jgi:hypothetical protein
MENIKENITKENITKEDIKKEDIQKEDDIKTEIIDYFKDLYKRSIEFIKNNKIELGALFVIFFLFFIINDNKKYEICNTFQRAGDPPQMTAQQQQQQMQQQQQQIQKQKEAAYRSKSQLAQLGFNKFGNVVMNSPVLTKIMCYIASFFKSAFAFFSLVFAVMLIPGVPIFGFMLLLFVILKVKMADLKAL